MAKTVKEQKKQSKIDKEQRVAPEVKEHVLSGEEIGTLVDEAGRHHRLVKKYGDALNNLKGKLKDEAISEMGIDGSYCRMEGKHVYDAIATRGNTTQVAAPTAILRALKKAGRLDLIDVVLKTSVGELKKYLGEQTLIEDGLLTVRENDGSLSITFKEKGNE